MFMGSNAGCYSPKKRGFSQAFDEFEDAIHSSRDTPRIFENKQHGLDPTVCCFGALYDIAIRFRQKPPVRIDELITVRTTEDGLAFFVLRLALKYDRGELQTETGSCVAMLNSGTFKNFQSIVALTSTHLECIISWQSLQNGKIETDYICAGLVYRAAFNVYGDRSESYLIAKGLSQHDLFLQDPECHKADIEYKNPQYLALPEEAFSTQASADHDVNLECIDRNTEKGSNEINIHSIVQDFEADAGLSLDLLVEQFAQHDYLLQARVDSKIKTNLLAHQKEGLDFLLRREGLATQQPRSLWQLVDSSDGPLSQMYQHRITGVKHTAPEDSCGGILADDMGLGKSLTMISAIVASMRAAQNFAVHLTTPPRQGVEAIIAAKTTLVIVPSALLMDNWAVEINNHTHWNTLSYYRYHGHNRYIPLHELLQYDVILTTYGTVAVEYRHKNSLLFQVKWYRAVLDEAHVIRNSATVQFRAVSSIWSRIRWCLTGTPIQNSLDDLGSLVAFLKIPILKEDAQFRRYIARPSTKKMKSYHPDYYNLQLLLGSICLRRNKTIMPFSQSWEQIDKVNLTIDERQAYFRYSNHWRTAIDMAVSGHNSKATHQTVLEAVLRMRMFCNHGDYHGDMQDTLTCNVEEMGSILQQKGEAVCHYCSCDILSFNNIANAGAGTVTVCGYSICGECLEQHEMQAHNQKRCPICKNEHTSPTKMPDLSGSLAYPGRQEYPAKVKSLCLNIRQHVHESKSIVFSFWRKSLDVVGSALKDWGVNYLRVDGAVPFGQRKRTLVQFQSAEQGMVLLMTLGTGAVGLNNLCVANRVHILEPQWNPSIESQAIGRVMRLGQVQTVHVTRYIVQNSIEESVQNGQLRKLQLATGGFGGGKMTLTKDKAQMVKDLISLQSATP